MVVKPFDVYQWRGDIAPFSLLNKGMQKITYKHWTKDKVLEITGTMPTRLNNNFNDRYVVQTPDGEYEDVIKETVISIEDIDTD